MGGQKTDPEMAFPVSGASILLLNRNTGKQSQCSGKTAASRTGRVAQLGGHPPLADYGNGQAVPSGGERGHTRVPAWQAERTEPVAWVPHGRYGAGGGHRRGACGDLRGTGGHQVVWLL